RRTLVNGTGVQRSPPNVLRGPRHTLLAGDESRRATPRSSAGSQTASTSSSLDTSSSSRTDRRRTAGPPPSFSSPLCQPHPPALSRPFRGGPHHGAAHVLAVKR